MIETPIPLPKSFKPKKYLSFSQMREALSSCFHTLEDNRVQGKTSYSLHDIMMSGFACMYFQCPSLLDFQEKLQEQLYRNNLQTLFGVKALPQKTQLCTVINETDSECFRPFFKALLHRLQRSKYLSQYEILGGRHLCSLDATQYHSSKNINCSRCLTQTHENERVTYSHKVLQGAIMHPDCRQVIPIMPEEIKLSDGAEKQDCETNAAKRLLPKLRKDHPQLPLVIVGDGLYSTTPMIEAIVAQRMDYILVAKPTNHKYMMEWLAVYPSLHHHEFTDKQGRKHRYEWMNEVPLNGEAGAPQINYFCYSLERADRKGQRSVTYRNSWVTNMKVNELNIVDLVRAGRCRWKIENECFNTLKNQGYEIEHNYGHGDQNLCHNFYLFTLLAFTFHQIIELTDNLFQACRAKFSSKRSLWERLRSHINTFVVDSWEILLEMIYLPDNFLITAVRRPP